MVKTAESEIERLAEPGSAQAGVCCPMGFPIPVVISSPLLARGETALLVIVRDGRILPQRQTPLTVEPRLPTS